MPNYGQRPPLEASDIVLKTYSGERIKTLGNARVTVTYKSQRWDTDLLVVEGDGPSLLGWNWIQRLNID